MARSDLLLSLVNAASRGDRLLLRKSVEAMVAEERAKQHHVLADQLLASLKESSEPRRVEFARDGANELVWERTPARGLDELILANDVRKALDEVVEEHHRADILRSYGLEPRHRLLLVGPPGNGKTSIAEALAEELAYPLLVVRYEALVGSFLGETSARIGRLFDHVRGRRCVLFFDEFETLGKERGDQHDMGEIKRVVSSLLLQIDALPSNVLVVTATNHPELLDRAMGRRFQLRLQLNQPDAAQVRAFLSRFETKSGVELGRLREALATKLDGLSFSEIEDVTSDILRRRALAEPGADTTRIIDERLKRLGVPARPRGASTGRTKKDKAHGGKTSRPAPSKRGSRR